MACRAADRLTRIFREIMGLGVSGAQERTRTFTAVKPLAPEASASTNSATWARAGEYGYGARLAHWAITLSRGRAHSATDWPTPPLPAQAPRQTTLAST